MIETETDIGTDLVGVGVCGSSPHVIHVRWVTVVELPADLCPFKEAHALLFAHTLKSLVRIQPSGLRSYKGDLSPEVAERYRQQS